MSQSIQYPSDYPEAAKTQTVDVVALVESGDWNTLNKVVICQDRDSNVVARFGDMHWDMSPYKRKESDRASFDFEAFSSSPSLLLELKLIVYGWLFFKSSRTSQASTLSTLTVRLVQLKTVYHFLASINKHSLSALSDSKKWAAFEDALIQKDYSKNNLEKIFVAINSVLRLEPWLNKRLGIDEINSVTLAAKLSDKEAQQTIVIPERIGDAIFGKAIELVEDAYPYREEIAHMEYSLQTNYLAGKSAVDKKIDSGRLQWLIDAEGNITNTARYAQEINKHEPQKKSDIIKTDLGAINELSSIRNGTDFKRYYSQLITACYICCGAFSGMRDSELGELTPKSYYREHFDNRDYHMLQSRTFKLGDKRETWVAAPIAEKAIALAATLTKHWRIALKEVNILYNNTLWVNHTARSKPPIVIDDWNGRLQRFCQQFDITVNESDYQECVESNPQSKDKIEKYIKVGQPWRLTTHQFRRSLAFYTIKHRLGTTLSLKQQFKHLYLSMTEWYTNGGRLASLKLLKIDSELQTTLNNANDEYTANKIFNMVHSEQKLSGSHGKAIVKMRDEIPHIYSSWNVIYAAVKNKTLTLHGTAHTYCKNGYNCDMDGVVNPAFCVDCSSGSSIIDEDNAKWWQKRHKALTTYLARDMDVSPSEYSHYITQIRAAEIVMKDFGMPFPAYEHPIEVVEL
ncbi:hypothetical protein KI743_13250 [Vibrio sp. D420a]|uniref:hypothetical protein n=1 Tax=Vibrio sp. D420a TaxID=2836895 RepID=UPI0025537D1A|nr:hypothetical protein [Vibrio sp. D420a]MDK9762972.1 hypothetical protein [Vibrio sp. D420a]